MLIPTFGMFPIWSYSLDRFYQQNKQTSICKLINNSYVKYTCPIWHICKHINNAIYECTCQYDITAQFFIHCKYLYIFSIYNICNIFKVITAFNNMKTTQSYSDFFLILTWQRCQSKVLTRLLLHMASEFTLS